MITITPHLDSSFRHVPLHVLMFLAIHEDCIRIIVLLNNTDQISLAAISHMMHRIHPNSLALIQHGKDNYKSVDSNTSIMHLCFGIFWLFAITYSLLMCYYTIQFDKDQWR